MNTARKIWHRPNGSRRWHPLGEAATEAAAWDAMFDIMKRYGSGGSCACPPHMPRPTPRTNCPAKPATRRGPTLWD